MTKSTAPRSARKNKSADAAPAVLMHTETVDVGQLALNDLIASLDMPAVITAAPVEAAITHEADMLDAAVQGAEAVEASLDAALPTEIDAGAVPSEVEVGVEAEAGVDAAIDAIKTPKRAALPRKHYSDKTERLKDKLGSELAGFSVLTLADAGVDEAGLDAVMESTMVIIRSMSGKAQNWAAKLIENLSGRKSSMSEVTARIFKLMERDGFITTGNTGNMYLDLLAKPYSPGAARAMGSNNLAMMLALKIIDADGKGRFVPNHDSLLLMKARSMLFAGTAADAEEDAELEEVVAAVTAPIEAEVEAVEVEAVEVEAEVEAVESVESVEPVNIAEYEDALM